MDEARSPGAADWLVSTYSESNKYGRIILFRSLGESPPNEESRQEWESESLRLVQRWKTEFPENFESEVARSRTNNRHRPEPLARLDAVEAALGVCRTS